ncbi:unnamed protein product, partial [Ixodes pacificus]
AVLARVLHSQGKEPVIAPGLAFVDGGLHCGRTQHRPLGSPASRGGVTEDHLGFRAEPRGTREHSSRGLASLQQFTSSPDLLCFHQLDIPAIRRHSSGEGLCRTK